MGVVHHGDESRSEQMTRVLPLILACFIPTAHTAPPRYIKGLLFQTQFAGCNPTDTTPIADANPEIIAAIAKAQQESSFPPALTKFVKMGGSVQLDVSFFMRGLDGPGSSQDLPFWQIELTDPNDPALENMPRTPTIASAFSVKMRFVVTAGPTQVRYVAPQYGADIEWTLPPNKERLSQRDAPGFVFLKLMGWSGMQVRVELQHIDQMAKEGGMGSSGAFNAGLLAGASMLTGAQLSEADILAIGTKIENADFGGLTGGQELLSSLLGGSYLHVWLSGLTSQYDAFSLPLGDQKTLHTLGKHAMYVQAGKQFADGKPVVIRTAGGVNTMWTDLLEDHDPAVAAPLSRMKALAGLYARAVGASDMDAVVRYVNEFVDLRVKMGQRWLKLLGDAMEVLQPLLAPSRIEDGALDNLSEQQLEDLTAQFGSVLGDQRREEGASVVPLYSINYAIKVWRHTSASYAELSAVRELWMKCSSTQAGPSMAENDLYISGDAAQLVTAARARKDIAVMPLGARGPGANLIALTSNNKGLSYLESFLGELGITELDNKQVGAIVSGSGTMRGWMPFTSAPVGWNATIQVSKDHSDADDGVMQHLGALINTKLTQSRPEPPATSWYDTHTGKTSLTQP